MMSTLLLHGTSQLKLGTVHIFKLKPTVVRHGSSLVRKRRRWPLFPHRNSEQTGLVRTKQVHLPQMRNSDVNTTKETALFRPEVALDMTAKIERLLSASLRIIDAKFALPPPPPPVPVLSPPVSRNVHLLKSALAFDFDFDDFNGPLHDQQEQQQPLQFKPHPPTVHTPNIVDASKDTIIKQKQEATAKDKEEYENLIFISKSPPPLNGRWAMKMVTADNVPEMLFWCEKYRRALLRQPNQAIAQMMMGRLTRMALNKFCDVYSEDCELETQKLTSVYQILWGICDIEVIDTSTLVQNLKTLLSVKHLSAHPLTDQLMVEIVIRFDSISWTDLADICRAFILSNDCRISFADRLADRLLREYQIDAQWGKFRLQTLYDYFKMCQVFPAEEAILYKALCELTTSEHMANLSGQN